MSKIDRRTYSQIFSRKEVIKTDKQIKELEARVKNDYEPSPEDLINSLKSSLEQHLCDELHLGQN